MFPSIAWKIWSRSEGGAETIDRPGTYIWYFIVPFPKSGIGWSVKIPLTDWTVSVTDVKSWNGGSKVYTEITNAKANISVTEAKLSPLQINALLAIGVFAALALLVDRIERVSPLLTVAVYGAVIIAVILVYVLYVQPSLKKRKKA
jgi:hypothetical protein